MLQATKDKVSILSAEEMKLYGYQIGKQLKKGDVVALTGELGAGKTTFVKGLAAGCAGIVEEEIISPTFTYLNIYEGFCHFDLYRVENLSQFIHMGFEEFLHTSTVCCIEWPEIVAPLLPKHTLFVHIEYKDEFSRQVTVS